MCACGDFMTSWQLLATWRTLFGMYSASACDAYQERWRRAFPRGQPVQLSPSQGLGTCLADTTILQCKGLPANFKK